MRPCGNTDCRGPDSALHQTICFWCHRMRCGCSQPVALTLTWKWYVPVRYSFSARYYCFLVFPNVRRQPWFYHKPSSVYIHLSSCSLIYHFTTHVLNAAQEDHLAGTSCWYSESFWGNETIWWWCITDTVDTSQLWVIDHRNPWSGSLDGSIRAIPQY